MFFGRCAALGGAIPNVMASILLRADEMIE
jgi:hypothetical protein